MNGRSLLTSEPRGGLASAVAPPRARRRPWVIAVGVMLTALGALTVMWLVGAAGQRQEVVVVRAAVPYGTAVLAEDLGVARVSLDPGIPAIPADRRGELIGQRAATQLVPGMLLVPGMVEESGEPRAGAVLVPIALASDRLPAGGLRAGDRVLAVDTASDEASGGIPAGPVEATFPATVVRIGPPDVNGVSVVDVTVSAGVGPRLAVAAASGRVAFVVQPVGG